MNTNKVVDHIVNWLKDYAENAKMEGFVVGISGGIDSAVTSILCAKTKLPTLCVEMPIHQSEKEVTRTTKHIQQLKNNFPNVNNELLDLTSVFEEFKKKAPKSANKGLLDLTLANTRARLRMTTLYHFAGIHRYLVVGTGNKIEDFGIGFFTKYGDGGVDISPVADLLKSEIYTLGYFLNVHESILKAAPTDGLFGDTRTDEDQIGASYDELEWAMKMDALKYNSSDFKNHEKSVFEIYKKLNTINQHKIKPIPVCIVPNNLIN